MIAKTYYSALADQNKIPFMRWQTVLLSQNYYFIENCFGKNIGVESGFFSEYSLFLRVSVFSSLRFALTLILQNTVAFGLSLLYIVCRILYVVQVVGVFSFIFSSPYSYKFKSFKMVKSARFDRLVDDQDVRHRRGRVGVQGINHRHHGRDQDQDLLFTIMISDL